MGAFRIARREGATDATSVSTAADAASTPRRPSGIAGNTSPGDPVIEPGRDWAPAQPENLPSSESQRSKQAQFPSALQHAHREVVHHADSGDECAECHQHREDDHSDGERLIDSLSHLGL
jgi:hypothetical protein